MLAPAVLALSVALLATGLALSRAPGLPREGFGAPAPAAPLRLERFPGDAFAVGAVAPPGEAFAAPPPGSGCAASPDGKYAMCVLGEVSQREVSLRTESGRTLRGSVPEFPSRAVYGVLDARSGDGATLRLMNAPESMLAALTGVRLGGRAVWRKDRTDTEAEATPEAGRFDPRTFALPVVALPTDMDGGERLALEYGGLDGARGQSNLRLRVLGG